MASSTEVTFDPKGKSFAQRLKGLKDHAKSAFGLTLKEASGTRTAEWQQKYHVAHMFAYNKYKSHKPAKTEKGGKTIAFDHAADPNTKWKKVDRNDFLRTKKGGKPKLKGSDWEKGFEPDKAATLNNVKAMLKNAGIGGGGTAMVAAGISPCGEPCKCTVGKSKHLAGEAVDIQKASLSNLESKLKAAKAGSLDDFLKKFGLHRPLKNHSTSPEPWHLEAL